MTTREKVKAEIDKLISASKESLGEIKSFAISEAWKILQLLTATVIQVIENIILITYRTNLHVIRLNGILWTLA